VRPLLGAEGGGEVGEDLTEVVHQLAGFSGGKKRELEHGSMISRL